MGTGCGLKWRDTGERERLFIVNPAHPIADGLPPHFDIPREEMYGEFFDIPTPDELVMISWFQGGNVFRSCCTWTRGKGKVAYFRPGHETFPTYHQPEVQRVIANAIRWAAPASRHPFSLGAPNEPQPL
jgi:trehalose utilization protein